MQNQFSRTELLLGSAGMERLFAARIHAINPDATVHTYKMFYLPETAGQFDFSEYDYVVDAIDTVSGKIALVMQAHGGRRPGAMRLLRRRQG